MNKLHTLIKRSKTVLLFIIGFNVALLAQKSNLDEDYSAYLPEVREFQKQMAKMRPPSDSNTKLTMEVLKKARQGLYSMIDTNTVLKPLCIKIDGPDGKIPLLIYKPEKVNGVVLEIHGGGWMVGAAIADAQFNDRLARDANVAVVSVDYRLAPENPFPACIEDCKAAARWLVNNSEKEFGTDKIAISGGSAGGHLAAVTTLFIRDSLHAIEKVKAVNLIYGLYDLSKTPSHRLANNSAYLSKNELAGIYHMVFSGWSAEQLRESQYSPLYADLHGLPPALFTVGTADPLADDTYFMEARWRMAGNKTYLAVYPECYHAFDLFPTQMAKIAQDKMVDWIGKAVLEN